MTVFWTRTAQLQRKHVFTYWDRRNGSTTYSVKLSALIKERTDLLKQFPGMGVATEFVDIRAVSMGYYTLLYKVVGAQVIIVGFWDNRQDPTLLLRTFAGR